MRPFAINPRLAVLRHAALLSVMLAQAGYLGCAATEQGVMTNPDDLIQGPPADAALEEPEAVLDDEMAARMAASLRALEAAGNDPSLYDFRNTPSARRMREGDNTAAPLTEGPTFAITEANTGDPAGDDSEANMVESTPLTPVAANTSPVEPSLADLADRLAARLAAEPDLAGAPIGRAVILAALLRLSSTSDEDWQAQIESLGLAPSEQATAIAIGGLVRTLSTDPSLNAADLIRTTARELNENRPLTIVRAKLCTRVTGFGQFDPLPTHTFMAGRKNRALVYVELDHFRHEAMTESNGDPAWRTRLSQELMLYHDADDLLAWRQPPQSTGAITRTPFNDYFVVNHIDLPISLTVGKYHLKVVMTDIIDGSTAETLLPIQVVADTALISAGG